MEVIGICQIVKPWFDWTLMARARHPIINEIDLCSISTHTITTRTISQVYSGGNSHTHMGAIYTMLEPCRSSCTGRFPRYISHPFQNCYDGYPSAVAGHAVACQVDNRAYKPRSNSWVVEGTLAIVPNSFHSCLG